MKYQVNKFLKIKKWDSDFFGFKIATLNPAGLKNNSVINFINHAKEQNIKCIFCLTSKKELSLEKNGFQNIEDKTTYYTDITNTHLNSETIQMALKNDKKKISEIARKSFRGISRFYTDTNFSNEKADHMYELWINKLYNDPAARIITIKDKNIICAFIGIKLDKKKGIIDLVAVDSSFQGKGLGKKLIDKSFIYFNKLGINNILVSTQESNIPARKLYEKKGFKIKSNQKWYHWWNK